MFNFFNKKQEKKAEDQAEFIELVKRWDAFLINIEGRFEDLLSHAESAVMDNLVTSNFDILPTTRAWNGIKSQLMGLMQKIEDTFDDNVKPKMQAFKEDYDLIDESKKGTRLAESIYHRINRCEIELEGKLALKFYDHAIQFLNEDFNCSQCGGKVNARNDLFRSHYLSCDYCNTVNTFTPNSKVNEIQGFAIDNIAKYKAIQEWEEMEKAEQLFGEIRCPHGTEDKTNYINGFKRREETLRTYWNKYYNERSQLLPETKASIESDVENKMKHFYSERKRELNF